ncbi:MAG: formate C-acetyltransferase/glycerol dehydratase family glycyl radical enzyme [Candidatus Bathyarchaeota archaeon]|nr:formate C-acetyltransferase/glycerol dehydratase family glycyl radical enzyme [Candidatus Bathyarchaeota archaeon]
MINFGSQNSVPLKTSRIEKLIDVVTNTPYSVCIERARYVTESYKETEAEPNPIRRAKAVKKILENMSLYILPDSLLVGNQAFKAKAAPLFPEDAVDHLEQEIIKGNPCFPEKRDAQPWEVHDGIRKELPEIIRYWKGKTFREKIWARLPKEVRICEDNLWLYMGFITESRDAHYIPDFPYLLNKGLKENIRICKEKLKSIDLTDYTAFERKAFWESVIISNEAVINFVHRYAKLAQDQMKRETNIQRKKELEKIAEVCKWIPENPARTFYEAIQFMYFIHLVLQIENSGQSLSIGRFDQYLYPFYQKDIQAGRITREDALELVQNYFVLLTNHNKFRGDIASRYLRGNPMHQNLTIGGVDPITHEDATNELTYIALEASINNRPCNEPQLSARIHRNAPKRYLMEIARAIRIGTGFPALFNDDCIVNCLISKGLDLDEAYDYGVVGCVETGVAGISLGRVPGPYENHPKWLEMALNNGKDPITGIQLHPGKGDLSSFKSFDEVYEAYIDQFDYYSDIEIMMNNAFDIALVECLNDPLMSSFGEPRTTIERGKSLRNGGTKYDYTGELNLSPAVVGDSLAAIKKLVFEEKKISGAQLLHALHTNFEDNTTSPTGEEIRQICLRAPKFGNDNDYVDSITTKAFRYCCERGTKARNGRAGMEGVIGGHFVLSTAFVTAYIPAGKMVGATPDGRKAGERLSDGCSPARGVDVEGPTAAVLSVAKYCNERILYGNLCNIKLTPKSLADKEGLERFIGLIRTFFDKKGWHIQFNVVSIETLRDAQKHPELYRSLLVRVAGYSARFIDLSPEVQEEVIARTLHSI